MISVPRMGLRVAGVLVLANVLMAPGLSGAYFAGGGKDAAKGNDCLIGYDFVDPDQVTLDGKKQLVLCTDCDPSCDLDGVSTANGSCTVAMGVCINQSGVAGCTPPSGLDKATAKGKVKGVKGDAGKIAIDVPQLLEGSACGAMVDVLIPLKTSNKGVKDGKATLSLSASVAKTEGAPKRSDKDKLTFVCQPRPEGEACPVTTTSSVSSTSTSTTLETTTTTVESTTSTSTSTSTSTTATSSTVVSTSTTLVSTSTTLVSTSTTVASTSTTQVTTTSTTTTTTDLCGNNTIDPGEECDGSDLGGVTCVSSPSSAILCTEACTLDYSQCPGDTTTSTTTPSTSTTVESTTTSTTASSTSTTSTTVESTTTSTSIPPSTTTTSTVATTTTTSTVPTVMSFTTADPTGVCGAVKSGGAAGTTRKVLNCGGLSVGGGQSTVAEGPTPGGAETQFNIAGGPIFTVSARTAAQTGSNRNCSDTGCQFGPYLPIANAGTSTCVRNTFATGGSGTLDSTTGDFTGSVPLTSEVFLTANGTDPCPRCIAGQCQAGWTSGVGPSPTEGDPCTATDAAGSTYDCEPPVGSALPSFPVDLTPITTGTASDSDAGGLFCPGQTGAGAFGCSGSGAANAICPGGNVPPVPDYIEENGTATGPVTSTPTATTLASVFCIPSVGGALGFLINGAANLPGPGATSLPGTLQLLP